MSKRNYISPLCIIMINILFITCIIYLITLLTRIIYQGIDDSLSIVIILFYSFKSMKKIAVNLNLEDANIKRNQYLNIFYKFRI